MAEERDFLYAPKKASCLVCSIPQPGWSEVNAAIWDAQERRDDYRIAGVRACLVYGVEVEVKSITRHAEHIESSWHSGIQYPPTAREQRVMPVDYDSLTDKAGRLGATAMDILVDRVPVMDNKDLTAVAKLGMGSVQHRAVLHQKQRQHGDLMGAIIGLGGGLYHDVIDGEAIDVTPVEHLYAELDEAKRQVGA